MLDRLPDPKPVTWEPTLDERVEYGQAVLGAIRDRGGKHPSSIDWDILWKWMEEGIPLRVVLGAIERMNPGKRLPSLAYARRGIEEEIDRWWRAVSVGSSR